MTSRTEGKERRREERVERRQAAEGSGRRRMWGYGLAAVLAVLLIAGFVVAIAGGSGGSSSSADVGGAFGTHYEGLGEREAAAKVPTMMDTMSSSYHVHPHITVYVDGGQVAVPADIGIDPARPSMEMAGLHTHDPSGTIHDEGMPGSRLGQFFAVWGVPFSNRRLGPYRASGPKAVRMWVDGKPSNAFGDLHLEDAQQIVVAFGTPAQVPGGVTG
ncbi:MAG: hypothetical protein J0H06_03120 [Actinobacteria bacterium]|nr:hypothetical protein [Actinomycetota bacterium]